MPDILETVLGIPSIPEDIPEEEREIINKFQVNINREPFKYFLLGSFSTAALFAGTLFVRVCEGSRGPTHNDRTVQVHGEENLPHPHDWWRARRGSWRLHPQVLQSH